MDKIIDAINLSQNDYVKKELKKVLSDGTDRLPELIVAILKKYKEGNYDNCDLLKHIIVKLKENIEGEKLKNILQNIRMDGITILDYVYQNKLFFPECDLCVLFFKNKVGFTKIKNDYLKNVFEFHDDLFYINKIPNYSKMILYQIIKNCKIIETMTNAQCVIDNLIYMFHIIEKRDYTKYKNIYMSFENYDKFYKFNAKHKHIKYFMIQILFFTMLEKINYKSLHKLMKTIIYNRELLSYLRKVLREDKNIATKYNNINEIAKDSIFINDENQILLNDMIEIIFNFSK